MAQFAHSVHAVVQGFEASECLVNSALGQCEFEYGSEFCGHCAVGLQDCRLSAGGESQRVSAAVEGIGYSPDQGTIDEVPHGGTDVRLANEYSLSDVGGGE
jgi:hypothetical protein